MFVVEKNVPMPESASGRLPKYPFRDLQVGESFLIPNCTPSQRVSALSRAKDFGIKVVTRSVEGGIRVWRTA